MATDVQRQIVDNASRDRVDPLYDDDNDDDFESAPPPPLPPLPPPPGLPDGDPVPLPPPPTSPRPPPSEPAVSSTVDHKRNVKQRYRVTDLEVKSTLGKK